MELSRKEALAIYLSAALFVASVASAAEIRAQHEHWRKGCPGEVQIDEQGIRFIPQTSGAKAHLWEWSWQDVQRLELSADRIVVVTYDDVRWRLGADRAVRFRAATGHDFLGAYQLVRDRGDVRLVAKVADRREPALWEIPVKRLGRTQGSHGRLRAGPKRLIYESLSDNKSMTWKYTQIQNLSSLGADRLVLTTSLGQSVFQLKAPLDQTRYDELWRKIQGAQGLSAPPIVHGEETGR